MIEAGIFATAVAVWGAVIGGVALLALWLLAMAVVSAWHVARVYRHGWLVVKDKHPARSIFLPFKMWLHFWLDAPRYVERQDGEGDRIYRPFVKHVSERYPG